MPDRTAVTTAAGTCGRWCATWRSSPGSCACAALS